MAQMVMVQMNDNGVYVGPDQNHTDVPAEELERLPLPIIVEEDVCGRRFREDLVGYKHKTTGVIFVSFEQFEAAFS